MTPFCVFLTQGKIWVRNKESKNELQVTNLNHKYFRQHLEDALSLGRPLLIEDITEELDPALDNILEKNFIKVPESMVNLRIHSHQAKVQAKNFFNDFRLFFDLFLLGLWSFSALLPLSLGVNRPLGASPGGALTGPKNSQFRTGVVKKIARPRDNHGSIPEEPCHSGGK